MGSCCSCLEATFVCLGDGIMFIVESLAAAINWIVSSILSVVVFIFDILTCHYCRHRHDRDEAMAEKV